MLAAWDHCAGGVGASEPKAETLGKGRGGNAPLLTIQLYKKSHTFWVSQINVATRIAHWKKIAPKVISTEECIPRAPESRKVAGRNPWSWENDAGLSYFYE
jgi:hypothetical protein